MPPLDTRTPTPRLAASRRPLDVVAIAAAALVNERYLDRRFTVHHLAAELRMPALLLRLRFRRCYGLGLDEHLGLATDGLAP